MDVDPDDNNGLDAGAIDEDDIYNPHISDDEEDVDEGPLRPATSRKRRRKARDSTAEDEAQDAATPSRLHPSDPGNFLKLCTALKILLSRKITNALLDQADNLIREYCLELVEVRLLWLYAISLLTQLQLYGPSVIRPNHHYAIHTPEFVRDYGPLTEFWTFLFERMNKVLKSFKTSNHAGGELETSFFREFLRTVRESRRVCL
jgi:hypothetical protein